jgi:hypothetical protein
MKRDVVISPYARPVIGPYVRLVILTGQKLWYSRWGELAEERRDGKEIRLQSQRPQVPESSQAFMLKVSSTQGLSCTAVPTSCLPMQAVLGAESPKLSNSNTSEHLLLPMLAAAGSRELYWLLSIWPLATKGQS